MELIEIQEGVPATKAKAGFCTRRATGLLAAVWIALPLFGCATPPTADAVFAWVEMVPQPQARAIVVAGAACPEVLVDGYALTMSLRVDAGTAPLRPPSNAGDPTKPAAFEVAVCSVDLPAQAHRASVGGRALALPSRTVQRIVVVGDTGCRVKGQELQDCNDTAKWPFARVAAAAAAQHPDLVIHVGDYHYRETPCPPGRDCHGPWGYGWDAWKADFFTPAAPLLGAAPWVLVRGNHEECSRAGQGWARFLAPVAYRADRSCNDPALDDVGNFDAPYAVPLGGGLQLVVFDSAHAGNNPLRPERPKDAVIQARYLEEMKQVAALTATPGLRSWFLSHHPVLAFAPRDSRPLQPYPGNAPLQSALRSVFGEAYFPPTVQLALHGHVHNFQAVDFSSPQPATLVAGNGGDNLDDRLPRPFPMNWPPAPGAVIDQITTASSFGFLVMERAAPESAEWRVRAFRVDGGLLASCRLGAQRTLRCDGLD
jgi:hypothetical protein